MPSRRQVGYVLSCEQFPPSVLIENAVRAEQVGFDLAWISDHFHPWMDNQGHASHAWIMLGAIGQQVSRLTLGTGVTCPGFRYRPPEVAQGFATLGTLYPGRVFLGVGAGEAVNEVPSGGGWGPYRERADRMVEAVELIQKLLTGEWVTHEGQYYPVKNARIYEAPKERVPIYIAASGPKSARIAGRLGDGWVTVGEAVLDPKIRTAFEEGAREAGKDPASMPILVEHYVVVGGQKEAEEAAYYWRFTAAVFGQVDEPDPRVILQRAEASSSLEDVYKNWLVSEDPAEHAAALEKYFDIGVTDLLVHSGQNDQARLIDFFGKRVLPLVPNRSR